jgi:hypothetical protein
MGAFLPHMGLFRQDISTKNQILIMFLFLVCGEPIWKQNLPDLL